MADTTRVETEGTDSGALDAPTDLSKLIVTNTDRYSEDNENHVPNPLYSTGTLDTSDTAGSADSAIEEVSPVFEAARAQNLVAAARALDPDDDGVPAELVVLPQGSVTVTGSVRTAEEAKAEIAAALNKLAESPVEIGGATPAQKEAAEENPDADVNQEQVSNRQDDGSTAGAPAGTDTTASSTSTSRTSSRRTGTSAKS